MQQFYVMLRENQLTLGLVLENVITILSLEPQRREQYGTTIWSTRSQRVSCNNTQSCTYNSITYRWPLTS